MADFPDKVLVIDDDSVVADSLVEPLSSHKIDVYGEGDVSKAINRFEKSQFEIVIIELEYAPVPGLAMVQKLRNSSSKQRQCAGIILASGRENSIGDQAVIAELGNIEVAMKPLIYGNLMPAVIEAMKNMKKACSKFDIKTQCHNTLTTTKDINQALTVCNSHQNTLENDFDFLVFDLLTRAGADKQAIDLANKLVDLSPDDSATLNLIGSYLYETKQLDQAKELLEKADSIAPRHLERIKMLANIYIAEGNTDVAMSRFRDLVALHPENHEFAYDVFYQLSSLGLNDEAIEIIKEFSDPTEVTRHFFNRGYSFQQSGNIAKALEEYQHGLQCYPKFRENYRVLFEIAHIEMAKRSQEGYLNAEAALESCLELFPFNRRARSFLVEVRAKLPSSHKYSA